MEAESDWKVGQVVAVEISSLSDSGEGVGRVGGRVVFVPDTVPGDRLMVRFVEVKRPFARAVVKELITPSAHRVRPACIVADKCGGCQWQHIAYSYQQEAKQTLVVETLTRLGKLTEPPVEPLLSSAQGLGYRNKVSYPLGRSATGTIKAGYYQKGTHKIVNLNQCPVQDERLNPFLANLKVDFQAAGWSVYDEKSHTGLLRHLCLRVGQRTGEVLLTLVATTADLPGLEKYSRQWLRRYSGLVGVCVNINADRTNRILGDRTLCIAGKPYVREALAGLTLHLGTEPFFQVNTEAAEVLVALILDYLRGKAIDLAIDAYCGIGTLTLPLARQVKRMIGIEVQAEAIQQAQQNAQLNQIKNILFQVGKVETMLPEWVKIPDLVVLDPPRQGCHPDAIATLLRLLPPHLIYVSCKPATLARDLHWLCQSGKYQLTRVQPVDFFPQTSHVECVAFLQTQRV